MGLVDEKQRRELANAHRDEVVPGSGVAIQPWRRRHSMMWGKHRENGIWFGSRSAWKLLWRGHDSLYIAAGRLRLRIMKP